MTKRRTILTSLFPAGLVLLAASCSDPGDYQITTPSQADKVMSIALTPSTPVPADGVSQLTLTVALDPAVKSSDRTVTLTTTAGSFVPPSANNSSQATVTADALGKATAILQAPSVPATAVIHVSVSDFSRDVTATFRQVTAADVFTLTSSSQTAAVNSTPGIAVQASLKFVGTATQQTVTFKTSLGTLVAPGASGTSVTVPGDLSANASVFLQSATPGTAQVQVTVGAFTQNLSLMFTAG